MKNLKISLESGWLPYGKGIFRSRVAAASPGRVHRVHRARSGLGFVVMNLGDRSFWSVDRCAKSHHLVIVGKPNRQMFFAIHQSPLDPLDSFGLPGAKGKKPWRFLLRDPNSKSQAHEFTIMFHRGDEWRIIEIWIIPISVYRCYII